MENNIILISDSYKCSHHKQYPPKTQKVYSYLEARGPVEHPDGFPETVFFGLQYYLKKYLQGQVITREKIEEAGEFFKEHFQNPDLYNKSGWEHILNKHGGKLPLSIKAVAEGTPVGRGNALMTLENTDPACFWLTNYLETLLVETWYPITVCTQSREIKMIILDFMERTGSDLSGIDFKLHDFGFRGVSSVESASLGAAAHLVNFKGTDTLAGIVMARKYYDCPMAGYSIPAAEHSTITSWGREHEVDAFENMLKQYPTGLVAVVSDSYDIDNACSNIWGNLLKEKVLARDGVVIIRPDSGSPRVSVLNALNRLGEAFGYTLNEKGFKVLNPKVRVIQGDGIDLQTIVTIFSDMLAEKWSGDNVAFGSGGALLQKMNRDTCRFAMKCSSIVVDGEERDVFKTPAHDSHKNSKKGRLKLILTNEGYKTVRDDQPGKDLLVEVFRDGEILKNYSFDEVRKLAFVK